MNKIYSFLILLIVLIAGFYLLVMAIGFYLAPQDPLENSDAIVVISGGDTYSRTIEGIKLYQSGYAPLLIFSGAASDPASPSNASTMRNIAKDDFDIPEEDIVIEEESVSTYDNASKLKQIFDTHGIQSIILVTSPYHQRRSKLTFQFVMGPQFVIRNHSATDEIWRKIAWWQNERALELTFSELWKIIYIKLTNQFQY